MLICQPALLLVVVVAVVLLITVEVVAAVVIVSLLEEVSCSGSNRINCASICAFRHAYSTGCGWFAGKQVYECKAQVHMADISRLTSLGSF